MLQKSLGQPNNHPFGMVPFTQLRGVDASLWVDSRLLVAGATTRTIRNPLEFFHFFQGEQQPYLIQISRYIVVYRMYLFIYIYICINKSGLAARDYLLFTKIYTHAKGQHIDSVWWWSSLKKEFESRGWTTSPRLLNMKKCSNLEGRKSGFGLFTGDVRDHLPVLEGILNTCMYSYLYNSMYRTYRYILYNKASATEINRA